MSKIKKTILNAVVAVLNMLVTSLIGLILSKAILDIYGSEYNGVNATISQIVSTIMILEGGFTLASNVALFKPLAEKDTNKINGILSATSKRFFTIGIFALVIGTVVAFIFPLLVSTGVPYYLMVALMLTVLIPACFNLGISMKYRAILLAEQKEYIIAIISTATYALGNILAIASIYSGNSILFARTIIMVSLLLNYALIDMYCKKNYTFINFTVAPLYGEIKGTRSVIVLKLTSVAYTSLPIVAISILPESGLVLASVYSVYKSVISIVKNSLASITNAPRLSFGALFVEGRTSEIKERFSEYELIVCILLSIVLGTTCIMILPFVELYTQGVNDGANYYNIPLAVIVLSTVFVEILHLPSGQMIQMGGLFEESKKIQFTACIVLLVTMILGGIFFGMYGVVVSVLVAALVLAVLEIGYVRKTIFENNYATFVQNVIPCLFICIFAMILGTRGTIRMTSYWGFFVAAVICVFTLSLVAFAIYFIIARRKMVSILGLVKSTLLKRTKT